MTIRMRTIFFIFIAVLLVWFLYVERTVLHPIVWGAIFAYILNPAVTFFSEKVKLPRSIAVVGVYLILMTLIVASGAYLARQLFTESSEIKDFSTYILVTAKSQINTMPDWIRPVANDLIYSLQKSRFFNSFSFLPFFPQAVSRIISFLIFIFSGYYFLREGGNMFEKLIRFVPKSYKVDVEILFRKIHAVLGQYLRGQIFLILLMAIATFIALTILGVRFALLLAVFSGFAEIVPLVGPIIAAAVAVLVVLLTGHVNFGLTPFSGALIVIAIYFVLRHAEDYFVIPHVMGKITQLPPFIIFLAVIAGGHIAGILGLILAVPVAAIIRLFLEFSLDQINGKK